MSELGAQTVSVTTALTCLNLISELLGGPRKQFNGEEPNTEAVSVNQLIGLCRKQGMKLRLMSLDRASLLIATAVVPVLLRLNNGKIIVALNSTEGHPEYIVASDPLYNDGKPFFLPGGALEQVWAGIPS